MERWIRARDLRTLYCGVAGVAAAGLLGGAFMHPDLRARDLEGPQMLAGVSGQRSAGPYDTGASLAAYAGNVPEYVIGTDWLRPPSPPTDELDARIDALARETDEAPVMAYAAEEHATDAIETHADPQTEPVSYPSTSGGRYYESDLPPPPAPPADAPAPTVG
jgi:hypothetical protein